MPRTKPSNPTYADYKRLARPPVSVTLPRWAVDYLYFVALDSRIDVFDILKRARKADGDVLTLTAPEVDLTDLVAAAGKAGRVRSAEVLRDAIQKAKAAPVASRKPRAEPTPKEPDDATETAREAMQRLYADGELTEAEIEAAKKRGLL